MTFQEVTEKSDFGFADNLDYKNLTNVPALKS